MCSRKNAKSTCSHNVDSTGHDSHRARERARENWWIAELMDTRDCLFTSELWKFDFIYRLLRLPPDVCVCLGGSDESALEYRMQWDWMASLSSEACVVGLGMFLFFSWLCVGVLCLFWGFWFWEALRQNSLSTCTLERVFRVSARQAILTLQNWCRRGVVGNICLSCRRGHLYLWVFFRKLVKKPYFWSFWWGLSLTSHLLVDESRV
jgi:hypothetical protein